MTPSHGPRCSVTHSSRGEPKEVRVGKPRPAGARPARPASSSGARRARRGSRSHPARSTSAARSESLAAAGSRAGPLSAWARTAPLRDDDAGDDRRQHQTAPPLRQGAPACEGLDFFCRSDSDTLVLTPSLAMPHIVSGPEIGRTPPRRPRTLVDMLGFGRKTTMIDPADALPGRDREMPVADRHAVLGTPMKPPFPEGFRARRSSGWAASGAPSACSGRRPACTRPRSATPAATRRTRPTRRSAPGAPATPRSCWSSSIRRRPRYDELLRLFWENHDPTQGMRQGNDVGTQYRSAIYWPTDAQREAAEASRDALRRASCGAAGYGEITTEIADGRAVLLRRGLPPAVPRTRTPGATAGSAAPASAARSASAASGARRRAPAPGDRAAYATPGRPARRPEAETRHQPPATAGRIVTSSPSSTGVSRPSRKRMSSPPT